MNLHWVVLGFPKHVQLKQRAKLVRDFTIAADVIITVVDVEEVI